MKLKTPYYLIDEQKLLKNLKIIEYVRDHSGARSMLALKCFASWCVFGLMKKYMDGTTSSSLYEARLGHEKFGKEVHAYSVAFSDEEIISAARFSDKIIFNSLSQLERYRFLLRGKNLGIRVNPRVSYSHYDLADPARKHSRLGIDSKDLKKALPFIRGIMFHYNCENDNYGDFLKSLEHITNIYGSILDRLDWVSLGGGFYFTKEGYPYRQFAARLKEFSDRFGIQVYLEPGEAAITCSGELVTSVLDVMNRGRDIAVVDASTEAHMLDLLIYRNSAKIPSNGKGRFTYSIAGRSCLAGDIFGTYRFPARLKVGISIRFQDALGYSIVKKNWFNGLPMPSIAVKRLDGTIRVTRRFTYPEYVASMA